MAHVRAHRDDARHPLDQALEQFDLEGCLNLTGQFDLSVPDRDRERAGSIQSTRWRMSSRISPAISWSARVKARTRSARVTMPISWPSSATTGSLLMLCSSISRAAAAAVVLGVIVMAGVVIASATVWACAFA